MLIRLLLTCVSFRQFKRSAGSAAVSDDAFTESIHASLAERDLLPQKHGGDTGYVNAPFFVSSQTRYGAELIGSTRADNHWQAKEGAGFAAAEFTIDWEHGQD